MATNFAIKLQLGLRLEYITLGWNVIGIGVLATAFVQARSVSLLGFGLDSLIEILASVVVVWELCTINSGNQTRALKIIGASFLVLAVYIAGMSFWVLRTGYHAPPSVMGIIWTAMTVIVMLGLAYGKNRVGQSISNPVLITEGKVTLIDAYLAAAVLLGLVANAFIGWWWADPIAGLVIVFYGLKEGRSALRAS
jgi:divalent metal cation (Fe/Co/Zn/Cd) transporter